MVLTLTGFCVSSVFISAADPVDPGVTLIGTGAISGSLTLFLDLLKDLYKVDATHTIKDVIAEKIEGLAWGPDLPDGRHVLFVMSDNDLNTGIATQIYAFAIDVGQAGISYQQQQVSGPLFPPGQAKKALK